MESAAKLRYRALPIIASPWVRESHDSLPHSSEESSIEKSEPVVSVREDRSSTPAFRQREEASSIELFYDLFFVANLTSFTTVHAIDDADTITSYIGFFAILWFTWLQVVLYHIRFGVDSLLERIAKLLHFGVMVTFAVVGTRFNPSAPHETYITMRQLSLVLVVSRLVLIGQYITAMMWVRKHENVTKPIKVHVIALGVGAALCLGLFFVFTETSSGQAYVVWYVIIVMEALAVFISSSRWEAVSFVHTNLNERCGLLTLIILGEGIIVLTKSMNYVVKGENFSGGICAQIISAVLIIYFVYTLYFDSQSPHPHHHHHHHHRPSSPSTHHAWALLHFPFHTSLVLLLEGTSRLITWRNAVEIIASLIAHYNDIYNAPSQSQNSTSQNTTTSTQAIASQLSTYSKEILKMVEADPVKYNVTGALRDLSYAGDPGGEVAMEKAMSVLVILVNATLKFFKIQPAASLSSSTSSPATDGSTGPDGVGGAGGGGVDPYTDLGNALVVYDLVFVYFFAAVGGTLVLLAALFILQKRAHRDDVHAGTTTTGGGVPRTGKLVKGDYLTVVIRVVVGIALALVAIVKTNAMAEERLLYSPWMLPSVMLALGIVVVGEGVVGWVLPRQSDTK